MTLRYLLFFLAFAILPVSAGSETALCDGGQVRAHADTREMVETVCRHTNDSIGRLARCNVVLDRPISVQLVDALSPGCMGLYHCGNDYIEILSPAAMAQARSFKGSLKHVATQEYFISILTHEIAHAAYESVECPYEHCLATTEYLAHTMQVMSLPAADIAALEATLDMTTHVPRDSLNALLYFMAPDKFLRKAWVHLNQRPDACSYIAGIMAGQIYMDRPHF